jgi:hypothetical protein
MKMNHRTYTLFFTITILWKIGCIVADSQEPANSPIVPLFKETAIFHGIDFVETSGSREKRYLFESKGAGVAVADVNGDGWDDIYFLNGGPDPARPNDPVPINCLYRNNGNGTFHDDTHRSGLGVPGYSTAAAFADYDNDGDVDCYVCNHGPNQLFQNDGTGAFTDVTSQSGTGDPRMSTASAFGDVDGDGDLDLFVCNYAHITAAIADRKGTWFNFSGHNAFLGPLSYDAEADVLYINNGNGTFSDETTSRGITPIAEGCGLGALFTDLDDDGDLDLFVGNDAAADCLYINDGTGYFEESALLAGLGLTDSGIALASMGIAAADFDCDNDIDLFVAGFEGEYNSLFQNNGEMNFADVTTLSHCGENSLLLVTFGAVAADFNNDFWPDIFTANGHVYPIVDLVPQCQGYALPSQLLLNHGKALFTDVSDKAGPDFTQKAVSRGAAVLDFDRDGDVDIIVNNLDGPAQLFENQSTPGNRLQIALQTETGAPAFGARVELTAEGRTQRQELHSSASFLSQNSAVLHFGLGNASHPQITVHWPDGKIEVFNPAPANCRMILRRQKSGSSIVAQEAFGGS